MALRPRDCNQDAVYWPKAGDGDDGLPYVTAGSGEEIKVRWTQQLRTGTDAKGNAVTTTVTIAALRLVDGAPARLTLGSLLWLGTLDEIPGTSEEPTGDLWVVLTETYAADSRGRNKRCEYGLGRHHDRLPLS